MICWSKAVKVEHIGCHTKIRILFEKGIKTFKTVGKDSFHLENFSFWFMLNINVFYFTKNTKIWINQISDRNRKFSNIHIIDLKTSAISQNPRISWYSCPASICMYMIKKSLAYILKSVGFWIVQKVVCTGVGSNIRIATKLNKKYNLMILNQH